MDKSSRYNRFANISVSSKEKMCAMKQLLVDIIIISSSFCRE